MSYSNYSTRETMDFDGTLLMNLPKANGIVYALIFTKLQYYETVKDSLTLLLVIVNNRLK